MKKKKLKKSAKAGGSPAGKHTASRRNAGDKFKRFQDLLLRKREDIMGMVKRKENDITLGEIGDEADVASQTFEREMMFELTNGERIVLDDIEAGLRKMEKGDYGSCESCRKKISSVRLRAMPWARYCIACQSRTETPSR
ncbi:MAG: hypothetical protein A2902_02415 [Elusimicrobia bacterium RIFCSPLOWO2_01_FULL_64_13]|nr:MAG: hypothetical protein A2636_04065 [Elusimicrobia bacterium RIFCSPHIGHO2_01_FULL_64_10]OGR94395.1 MAG: hypothetical protein A2902_02415 [Elusimicrobia bacterium RIFCSPLOWO2_01_FULL_64_13]